MKRFEAIFIGSVNGKIVRLEIQKKDKDAVEKYIKKFFWIDKIVSIEEIKKEDQK